MRRSLFFLLLIWTFLAPAAASAGTELLRSLGSAISVEELAPEEPAVDLRTWVEVDRALLESAPAELTFELPDGLVVTARRESFETRGPGRVTWRGTAGPREPVILTLHDGFVVGRIHFAGASYSLAPVHGHHRLARLLPGAFPECGGSLHPDRELAARMGLREGLTAQALPSLAPLPTSLPAPMTGPVATLDVLFLYTPLSRDWAGGQEAIEALVQSAIDLANTAFANSQVNARARLVGALERDLVEGFSEEMGVLLRRITEDPEIAQRRDETRADLVSLLINATEDGSGFCGVAWAMERNLLGPQFAGLGFSVNRVQCAVDSLTFPHEIAHNMGAGHLPGDPDPQQASFPWSFGHIEQGLFRTIMAPTSACQSQAFRCPRIPHFSNPDVLSFDLPTGIPGERDLHRTLNQTTPIAAAFRLGSADRPAAPGNLTANAITPTSVELAWNDRATNETGFRIERAEGDGPFTQVPGTLPRNTGSTVLTDLAPDTRHRFRVRARNSAGFSPFSNVAEATTLPDAPPVPAGLTAEAVSETSVRVSWIPPADVAVHLEMSSPAAGFTEVAAFVSATGATVIEDLDPAAPYTFRLRASNESGFSPYGDDVSVTTLGRSGPCVEADEILCLLDGRFEVRVAWRNPRQEGDRGIGQAVPVPGSALSGTFWFFSPQNIELIVKMLDGTTLNGFFWHFYGALSDVEYWISVRDTETGESRTFHNPPFEICGQADTEAFALEPLGGGGEPARIGGASGLRSGVLAGAAEEPLRFLDRFEVEVEWHDPRSGDRGVGCPLPDLSTGETGFLWFFQPENIELVIKILDGRVINDHFWLFWGGLSDVEYTIRVTDTSEGTETTYTNEAFNLCGGVDVETL